MIVALRVVAVVAIVFSQSTPVHSQESKICKPWCAGDKFAHLSWEKRCRKTKCAGCPECPQQAKDDETGAPSSPPTGAPSELQQAQAQLTKAEQDRTQLESQVKDLKAAKAALEGQLSTCQLSTKKSASDTAKNASTLESLVLTGCKAEQRAMDHRSKALSRCTDVGGNLTCDKLPWGWDGKKDPQGSQGMIGDKYADCSDSLTTGMYLFQSEKNSYCEGYARAPHLAMSHIVPVMTNAKHLKAMGLTEGYTVMSKASIWKVRMAEDDVGAYGFKRIVCEPKSEDAVGRCHVYKIGHCIKCPNFRFLHSDNKKPTTWSEWVARDGEGGLAEFAKKCLGSEQVYHKNQWRPLAKPFRLSESGQVELKPEYACSEADEQKFTNEFRVL